MFLHITQGSANPKLYFNLTPDKMRAILDAWKIENTLRVVQQDSTGLFIEATPKDNNQHGDNVPLF